MDFSSIPFVANATPSAGGAGPAVWEALATTSGGSLNPGGSGVVLTKPSGTVASDILICIRWAAGLSANADLLPGAGWTLIGETYSSAASNTGIAAWWAPGDVADNAWFQSTLYGQNATFDVHRISGANTTTPIRAFAEMNVPDDWASATPNMPSPSVTANAGDCIIAHYRAQNAATLTTPQADYTRVMNIGSGGQNSTLQRSNVPAGVTGTISHGATAAFEGRTSFTIAIAAAS